MTSLHRPEFCLMVEVSRLWLQWNRREHSNLLMLEHHQEPTVCPSFDNKSNIDVFAPFLDPVIRLKNDSSTSFDLSNPASSNFITSIQRPTSVCNCAAHYWARHQRSLLLPWPRETELLPGMGFLLQWVFFSHPLMYSIESTVNVNSVLLKHSIYFCFSGLMAVLVVIIK
ncbi:unnamed protein product [Clavelina lepadiformis]|uniref:Uncharacterized protein n=1 Tax=Clavelina lepadiformis TaxID=159417 RepID=A0ABP0FL09_CLALP